MDEKDKQGNWEVKSSRIQMKARPEDENVFRKEQQRRHGLEKRGRTLVCMAVVLAVSLLLAPILPTNVFTANGTLSLAECISQMRSSIAGIAAGFGGTGDLALNYRAFRYMTVGTVGAALAVSGAVYQGSFRNALASPSTLGVQSGGVLGGTIYVMFIADFSTETVTASEFGERLQGMNLFQQNAQSFFILLGCFVGVAFIVTISKIVGRGKVSSIALILAGTVFGSLISGCVELLQYWLLIYDTYGARTYALRFLMLGTFDRVVSLQSTLLVVVPALVAMGIMILMRGRLNLLVFGEDEARSMGIRVELTRNVMVGVVTALTAIVISFCGQIGFVGFIIPHLARRFVGPDFRYLVPGSALLGGICMIVVYYAASLVGYTSNINFITSLVGGSIFLVMVVAYRNRRNADWA